MKKNEVLEMLSVESTEKGLSNIGVRYGTISATLGYEEVLPLGYALIEVDEGILKVPYFRADASDGYEQFAYEEAEIATEEELDAILKNAEEQQGIIRAFVSKGKPASLDINGNRPVLLKELQELQADLVGLTDIDLLDYRKYMLASVNRCLEAVGETDEVNI